MLNNNDVVYSIGDLKKVCISFGYKLTVSSACLLVTTENSTFEYENNYYGLVDAIGDVTTEFGIKD